MTPHQWQLASAEIQKAYKMGDQTAVKYNKNNLYECPRCKCMILARLDQINTIKPTQISEDCDEEVVNLIQEL